MSGKYTEAADRQRRDLPAWLFYALACVLPFALLLIHRRLGHQNDMLFFFDWYQAISAALDFYSDGPGINYPILGVVWLCVPAWLVEVVTGEELHFGSYRDVLKITLTTAEVLLIVTFSRLARTLGVQRPRLLALALYVLPSTWASGAWFGQLNVVGSLLLLLAALGIVRYALAVLRSNSGTGWLLVGVCALHGAILTKQLTLFSLPGLSAMLALGLVLDIGRGSPRRWLHLGLVLASPLLWFAADPLLTLPTGYWSHFAFVLFGGGSSHADLVCASGANVWALLYPGGGHSARETMLWGFQVRTWAIAQFGVVQLLLLAYFSRDSIRKIRPIADMKLDDLRNLLGVGILLVGVSNLAMVNVLTGIHERYLVHGVPFLVLGISLITIDESPLWRMLRASVFVLGAWSGLFVLASLHWRAFDGSLSTFRSTDAMALLQLVVFVAVIAALVARSREKIQGAHST